jgi:type III secretory pathway component EscV
MKRYFTHKYLRGGSTLIVHLVDPQLESLLATRGNALSDIERDRILDAFREGLRRRSSSSIAPTILTATTVRRDLKRLLDGEFPRLAVLCYQELTPDTNIQPIGRISM